MSEIKPFEPLLHRELSIHDVTAHYSEQLSATKSITDYGTSLVALMFSTSEKKIADLVLIGVLLKQVVSQLDSIHVLASAACADSLLLNCRALFEASVYIDWMLNDQPDAKAACYYVANLRRERIWLLRANEDTDESKALFSDMGDYTEALKRTRSRLANESEERLREVETILNSEDFSDANQRLEKARGKRKHEANWHSPFGCTSFRAIAKEMGRLAEYETLYSNASEKMHGSGYKYHVRFEDNGVRFREIRSLEGLGTSLSFALGMTLHTYGNLIKAYRPGQIKEFDEKYVEHWQTAYMKIPKITYTPPIKEIWL